MSGPTFEPVIGVEIHAQLATQSKMFCGCNADYADSEPNSHVCAICAGMPGALPSVNRSAVLFGVMTSLALGCQVAETSKFDRKNYSYPDLPKGYQISQYDLPLGVDGIVQYEVEGVIHTCRITRVHLEEDTGKLLHEGEANGLTFVDYNRSGVPLMEIVSEPDIPSAEAAREYFSGVRSILMYLGVNDGNLQQGSMRADLNVSLRRPGHGLPATKVEIKNLNSFRAVERAIAFEIERQRGLLERGLAVPQETRGWSETQEMTLAQRSKEQAHDYRYFPEPDLPPLRVTEEMVSQARAIMPELPLKRRDRLVEQYQLPVSMATVIVDNRALADYFEAVSAASVVVSSTDVGNWVTNDLLRLVKESGAQFDPERVPATTLARLLTLIAHSKLSGKAAKQVLETVFLDGDDVDEIIDRRNLRMVTDRTCIRDWVKSILDRNPEQVESYRKGKIAVKQALVGQVMGLSRGKADPLLVQEEMAAALAQEMNE